MDYEGAKNKLAEVYGAIQNLQIQPTQANVNIMALTMKNLDEVYNFLDTEQNKAKAEVEEKKED